MLNNNIHGEYQYAEKHMHGCAICKKPIFISSYLCGSHFRKLSKSLKSQLSIILKKYINSRFDQSISNKQSQEIADKLALVKAKVKEYFSNLEK